MKKNKKTLESTLTRIAELRKEIDDRQTELGELASELEEFKWQADADLKALAAEGIKPKSHFV